MLIYDVCDFTRGKNSWALVNAGTWYQDILIETRERDQIKNKVHRWKFSQGKNGTGTLSR